MERRSKTRRHATAKVRLLDSALHTTQQNPSTALDAFSLSVYPSNPTPCGYAPPTTSFRPSQSSYKITSVYLPIRLARSQLLTVDSSNLPTVKFQEIIREGQSTIVRRPPSSLRIFFELLSATVTGRPHESSNSAFNQISICHASLYP